jgi:hypothetical protein
MSGKEDVMSGSIFEPCPTCEEDLEAGDLAVIAVDEPVENIGLFHEECWETQKAVEPNPWREIRSGYLLGGRPSG